MDFVVIGLSGKATSGKSTTCEFVKQFIANNYPDYGFSHCSFAAKLKDIAYSLFGWNGDKSLYPEEDQGRKLLINIGEKMREIRADVWADYICEKIKNDIVLGTAHNRVYVVDDLRYENELDLLRDTFGQKFFWVKIERNGIVGLDLDSEKGLDGVTGEDFVIQNDSLDILEQRTRIMVLTAFSRMKERMHI